MKEVITNMYCNFSENNNLTVGEPPVKTSGHYIYICSWVAHPCTELVGALYIYIYIFIHICTHLYTNFKIRLAFAFMR